MGVFVVICQLITSVPEIFLARLAPMLLSETIITFPANRMNTEGIQNGLVKNDIMTIHCHLC